MSEVLSSWARRRAAVEAEEAAFEAAEQDAILEAEQAELAEKSDEDILADLGLPDPDSMVQGDDFKAFMSKAVPEHLRKRALRKLWRSNPVLACVDGLNDYDDDYLTQGLNQGPIKTSYQVGKGMLAHLLEVERQKEKAAAEDDSAPDLADVPQEADIAEPEMLDVETADTSTEPEEDVVAPTPRRMQFEFKDASA